MVFRCEHSLARAIGFNRPVVKLFHDNIRDVFSRKSYSPDYIYNMDETGVAAVSSRNRVLAKKGITSRISVGRIVSDERGTVVTIGYGSNAVGNCVPPMFICPRQNYRDYLLRGAPPGSTERKTEKQHF